MTVQTDQSYRRLPQCHEIELKLPSNTRWPKRMCVLYLGVCATFGILTFIIIALYTANTLQESSKVLNPFHLLKSVYRAQVYSIKSKESTRKVQVQSVPQEHSKDLRHVVVSCYYNMPSGSGLKQLLPADLHPHLCTHINVAFARVVNKEIYLDNNQYKILKEIVTLKKRNPQLYILVSIGGAGDDNGFSDMVINHAARKIFIKSIKNLLHNYTLDGIDLDWEFPAMHSRLIERSGSRERQHFSQLLREIRMEYIREKRDYLLTVAMPAPESIVDVSYDVDQINLYVDYVNVMTYDFHYYTKYTPFTGFNSPLYPRHSEQFFLATLNINYTVHMYLNKGLGRNKIVLGIPTYGHTFKLVNPNNPNVGSPASGFGTLGSLGFVNYPDVCIFLRSSGNKAQVVFDNDTRVPYLYENTEWVSYDTSESVMEKANFIKVNGLRGAMIYSLNADDYEGVCHERRDPEGDARFPLSQSVKNTLMSNSSRPADTNNSI